MKKLSLILALITLVLSISIVFAEDNIIRECDSEVITGTLKTQTCWYYNNSRERVVHPKLGYAGEMDVYEDILPRDDSFSHVSTVYLDPEGNPMMGPCRSNRLTAYVAEHHSWNCLLELKPPYQLNGSIKS